MPPDSLARALTQRIGYRATLISGNAFMYQGDSKNAMEQFEALIRFMAAGCGYRLARVKT